MEPGEGSRADDRDSEIERLTLARRRDVLTKCPSSPGIPGSRLAQHVVPNEDGSTPQSDFWSLREFFGTGEDKIEFSSSSTTLVLSLDEGGNSRAKPLQFVVTASSSASKTLRGGLSGVPSVVRAGPKTRVAMALVRAYSVKTSASSSVSKTITEPAEQMSLSDTS
jgi:hypothetical protein